MKRPIFRKTRTIRNQANHRFRALSNRNLSTKDVAVQLDYSEAYIRKIFQRGRAPYQLATRLARLLNCRMENFL